MTQRELIDKVHEELTEKVPLAEITHRLSVVIAGEGVTDFKEFFRMLEPAGCAYVHTYPDDISDGPWDI